MKISLDSAKIIHLKILDKISLGVIDATIDKLAHEIFLGCAKKQTICVPLIETTRTD